MKLDELEGVYWEVGTGYPRIGQGIEHVEFTIRCRVCHFGLCQFVSVVERKKTKGDMIFVEPCPNCMKALKEGKEVIPYEMNGNYETREEFPYDDYKVRRLE